MKLRAVVKTAITYELADGGRTHSPLIVASVGGRQARFALDTGSEVHLLTNEFVDDLALARVPGEEGTDHGGERVASWAVPDVELVLGESTIALDDVVSIPAPPPFPGWGIAGILSPQRLRSAGWSVLDLAADELLLVDGSDEVLQAYVAARHPEMNLLRLVRDVDYESLVISAQLPPNPPMPMMLNSGGRDTEFARELVRDMSPADIVRLGGGVSGADVLGARIGCRTIIVGHRSIKVSDAAVRETMHAPYGLIGMDVLRGTVLACAADRRQPVLWLVP